MAEGEHQEHESRHRNKIPPPVFGQRPAGQCEEERYKSHKDRQEIRAISVLDQRIPLCGRRQRRPEEIRHQHFHQQQRVERPVRRLAVAQALRASARMAEEFRGRQELHRAQSDHEASGQHKSDHDAQIRGRGERPKRTSQVERVSKAKAECGDQGERLGGEILQRKNQSQENPGANALTTPQSPPQRGGAFLRPCRWRDFNHPRVG